MSHSLRSRSRWRPAIALAAALLVLLGIGVLSPGSASAGYYKVIACSANAGAPPYQIDTNTKSPEDPNGSFRIFNRCKGEGGDPPGESALLRIQEDRDAPGSIRQGAYENVYFDAPPSTHFKAAGGFTREPYQFNDGWRARFWIASAGANQQILSQGAGANANGQSPSSSIFAPHLWPVGGYLDFNRFAFELTCVRAARCDVSGNNAADLNGVVFVMSDDSDPQAEFTGLEQPMLAGRWVKGTQTATFNVADAGSGIRWEHLFVDASEQWSLDHGSECNTIATQANGEAARAYSPCPTGGPWARSVPVNTAAFKDGQHTIQVCGQDFGQYQGISGTGGQTCTARTIETDNTAPAAPGGLSVVTPNAARYIDHFGAQFSLPPNEGSPITHAYYNVVDAAGNVITPAQSISGTNPTAIQTIAGPNKPGDYRLRVWLEDEVGFTSPAATVQIPHDTTPPAAPQNLSVVAPKSPKGSSGFDMTWHNLVDSGSPIDEAHYRIVDAEGAAVVPDQIVDGENIEAIKSLDTPRDRGGFTLQLWLSDAEGNVGAPVSVPLVYDCVRDDVDAGALLSSNLGPEGASRQLVKEGSGGLLEGKLLDPSGAPVGNAPICVFSQVKTDSVRRFLGVAVTSDDGSYEFAVKPGASRDLIVDYRSEHREISSKVQLITRVHPTFEVENPTLRNKAVLHFSGTLPGPHNNQVIVVLQARKGNGWIVFHRYTTGKYGNYAGTYRFNATRTATEYIMRAQIRSQKGYPYHGGSSAVEQVIVYPHRVPKSAADGTSGNGHRHGKHHRHHRGTHQKGAAGDGAKHTHHSGGHHHPRCDQSHQDRARARRGGGACTKGHGDRTRKSKSTSQAKGGKGSSRSHA